MRLWNALACRQLNRSCLAAVTIDDMLGVTYAAIRLILRCAVLLHDLFQS